MSFRELVAALLRRGYIIVAVVLLGAAGFVALQSAGGVFVTKPIVAFILPGHRVSTADNGLQVDGVIAFAVTIAETVNNGRPIERYAAEDAPLYGAGANEEVRIGVPNVGGQWNTSYTRAEIAISIVGRSEEWVSETQKAMLTRVLEAAESEQRLRSVPPNSWMESYIVPLSTRIEYVGSSTSQRAMAAGALGGASLLVGCWIALRVDLAVARRRDSRKPMPSLATVVAPQVTKVGRP